jgi:hypothetical protein
MRSTARSSRVTHAFLVDGHDYVTRAQHSEIFHVTALGVGADAKT